MQTVIDIDEEIYNYIHNEHIAMRICDSHKIAKAIANGIPLDKIRAEIENIEINGHIRDVECFNAGVNTALNIIDKYNEESEEV